MKKITDFSSWQKLKEHHNKISSQTMMSWFEEDPSRFSKFSVEWNEILFDFSKNRITSDTLELLIQLATEIGLKTKINALFSGQPINTTEKRPVLHMALRNPDQSSLMVNEKNIMADIRHNLKKITTFVDSIHSEKYLGVTGKPINTIVNIGIGGSNLGPLMTTHALQDFKIKNLQMHFISNVDGAHLKDVLTKINPESTLFIVSTKSFNTIETTTHMQSIKKWLQEKLDALDVAKHFVAVTANLAAAKKYGFEDSAIFQMWDWVGGRYSIWSAIGLPLALMIGMKNFEDFLGGAYAIDKHFQEASFEKNIPVLLALIGIWYINFFNATQHVIAPYSHHLDFFPQYVQQIDMESNGKSITLQGEKTSYFTGPVLLGEQGCNAQHAYNQWLHQAPNFIPVDFILTGHTNSFDEHQDILIASALSQAQALMKGKNLQEALDELVQSGMNVTDAKSLATHKVIPGNRPSNVLFLKKLTPFNLGALMAIYEHKIFVQGCIWQINSFDQWGVELGKQLLPNVLAQFSGSNKFAADSSTIALSEYYKNLRNKK